MDTVLFLGLKTPLHGRQDACPASLEQRGRSGRPLFGRTRLAATASNARRPRRVVVVRSDLFGRVMETRTAPRNHFVTAKVVPARAILTLQLAPTKPLAPVTRVRPCPPFCDPVCIQIYQPHFVDRLEIEHTNLSYDSSGGNDDQDKTCSRNCALAASVTCLAGISPWRGVFGRLR